MTLHPAHALEQRLTHSIRKRSRAETSSNMSEGRLKSFKNKGRDQEVSTRARETLRRSEFSAFRQEMRRRRNAVTVELRKVSPQANQSGNRFHNMKTQHKRDENLLKRRNVDEVDAVGDDSDGAVSRRSRCQPRARITRDLSSKWPTSSINCPR